MVKLEKASCHTIESLVNRAHLKWISHTTSMYENYLLKCMFNDELVLLPSFSECTKKINQTGPKLTKL